MLDSRHTIDGGEELLPAATLAGENLLAFRGDAIVPAPPLAGLFNPSSGDESTLLEPEQQRIQRGGVEREHALRSRGDQLAQVVAVPRLLLEQREDEHLRAAFLHRQF